MCNESAYLAKLDQRMAHIGDVPEEMRIVKDDFITPTEGGGNEVHDTPTEGGVNVYLGISGYIWSPYDPY